MSPASVNGEPAEGLDGITIAELVARQGLPGRGIAVARNGEVVPRSSWATVTVEPGDAIDIVTAVAGG